MMARHWSAAYSKLMWKSDLEARQKRQFKRSNDNHMPGLSHPTSSTRILQRDKWGAYISYAWFREG